jgi:hypothetical protein
MRFSPGCLLCFAIASLSVQVFASEGETSGIDFFESRIRPVLVQHCYECHSTQAKTIEGGLRLDSRDSMLTGGDGGRIIEPGDPDASRLLQAIRYEDLEMPPNGQLPEAVAADFAKWIRSGAEIPSHHAAKQAEVVDPNAARSHWAFQPIRPPKLPAVKRSDWCKTRIDSFILARQEEAGLTPNDTADARTLIRRAYFDLIGLPPTFDEVQAFVRDPSPDAYQRLVDRLLASPHYGERWGRHWLDVARYSDTKDLVLEFGNDRIRPYAYTYRDYVIRAFNADKPYDRFIHEQLAADLLPDRETESLAAMGFLTLGRLFDNNLPDIYDDYIDTVGRGLLGLTISCARCHDHKYDPIPTEDYYSLYGVFANSESPIQLPLIGQSQADADSEFARKVAQKEKELADHIDAQYDQLTRQARSRVADYLLRMTEPPDPLETTVFYLSLSPEDLRPQILAKWRRYLQKARDDDPVFGPWKDLVTHAAEPYSEHVRQVLGRWRSVPVGTASGQVNPAVLAALENAELNNTRDVAQVYGKLLLEAWNQADAELGQSAGSTSDDSSRAVQQLRAVLTAQDGPCSFPKRNTYLYMARVERDKFHNLIREIDRMAVESADAPPRAMVLYDSPDILPTHVFVRGNPRVPGREVPRQFLGFLAPDRQPFARGSGRLELAQAITSPDNPLTSRVIANRIWMHHFGQPLVSMPGDFGMRSDLPSHPELLDYLAWTLQQSRWSIKTLHREIMLSAAYQQASTARSNGSAIDPDNRWLWRTFVRRLELEPMRDAMLSVSNELNTELYGRPERRIDLPASRRRTIYGLIDRQELPGVFRVFDFASPDQSSDKRPRTITPQQALFSLNSPFVIARSKALASRTTSADPAERVRELFRLSLARDPNDNEVRRLLAYVEQTQQETSDTNAAWEQVAQALLVSNEFVFVD